jgi:hypothetical protein
MLDVEVLKTELASLALTLNESDSITTLVNAYGTYATDAQTSVTNIPILPAGIVLGKAAMSPALVGMSVSGQGATKLQSAITAFWVAAAIPVSFTGSTGVVPPAISTLSSLLVPTFVTNTSGSKNKTDSIAAFATDIHTATLTPPGVVTFITGAENII